MIREKAKDLLTKLKQGTGSATLFGSSYYDEETLKIIEIITNQCKAKLIEEDGTIKKYESNILIENVKEIVMQLLTDNNTVKNSLICILTQNGERNIPGITKEVRIEKKVNEKGIPYIDINTPFPDNFHEIISGQINREELEREIIKPYLARVCKKQKELSKRHFISRIFSPLNRKELTNCELINKFEDYLRRNTVLSEEEIQIMSKYFILNILEKSNIEQELVNTELQGKSVSQKGKKNGYNYMIQNMSNELFEILNIIPNPNDSLKEIQDIYANTVGQLEALSVEPSREPDVLEEQIKNINRNINRHRQQYYGQNSYRNVSVGFDGKDAQFTSVEHVQKAMQLYIRSIVEVLERAKEMNDEEYIKQVAKLHFRFIQIHPFPDGNGRTARAISNMLLLEKGMAAVFEKETKTEYLASMNMLRGLVDKDYIEALYTDHSICDRLESERYYYKLEEYIGMKCLDKSELYADRNITVDLRELPELHNTEDVEESR